MYHQDKQRLWKLKFKVVYYWDNSYIIGLLPAFGERARDFEEGFYFLEPSGDGPSHVQYFLGLPSTCIGALCI